MTPNKSFTKHGCGYLGLPSRTFRFFHPFLRPRQEGGRVPPPCGHYGEKAHQFRKARSNALSDSIQSVWQTTMENGVESLKEVELVKLQDLGRPR